MHSQIIIMMMVITIIIIIIIIMESSFALFSLSVLINVAKVVRIVVFSARSSSAVKRSQLIILYIYIVLILLFPFDTFANYFVLFLYTRTHSPAP